MNFQQQVNGTYEYVQVAAFERGSLIMENSTIQWKGATGQPPTSICSEECTKGYAKVSNKSDIKSCVAQKTWCSCCDR